MLGSDTSGLEYVPPKPADSQAVGGSFNPVHVYLLVEQGVHIGEFHNLEELAADRVYEFAYVADDQRDPRHRRRHCAAADRDALI